MPRIDPQQLLNCLNPLLAPNGGIKSSAEVIRLASLMEKYSKKLVSKCIYVQILKCTDSDLLGQFMAAGGWNLVHFWLKDGSESSNWPLVQEILEMLLLCPVDGNRLKSNHTPKIVKNLSLNCAQNGVRILSNKLVEQWLKIAHQEKQQQSPTTNGNVNGTTLNYSNNNNLNVDNDKKMLVDELVVKNEKENDLQTDVDKKTSENAIKYKISPKETGLVLSIKRSISPPISDEKEKEDVKVKTESKSKSSSDKKKSSSSHKSSSSSKSSHKDKERSSSSHKSSSSSSSSKDRHRSSSSSSKHSSSRDKDKSKDRDKHKKDIDKEQAEKDKETLSFLTPLSSHKLQRIPKRQHSETNENKDSNDLEPSSKAVKTSEPVERKKPSISIEVRKGDKPKTVKTLNSKFRNHGLAEEPPPPPSRKDLTKKVSTTTVPATLSVHTPTITTASSKVATSPTINKKIEKALESEVPERAGGVKLIKPKPMLVESTGFLAALDEQITKKEPKKRKRIPSTSSSSKKEEPESPKIEAKPLKFYKDTLEEPEEKSNGTTSPSKEVDKSPDASKEGDESVKENSPKADEVKTEEVPEEETFKRPPGVGTGPDGPPGVIVDPLRPRKAKRSIKWKPDTELTDIRYFELDENERVNVTRTFAEQKLNEHHSERDALLLGRKLGTDDVMTEQIAWRKLIIIDNVPEINHGYKSTEVQVQLEREKVTLQDLFYAQADSPAEPDPEHFTPSDPVHIPIDDVTGNPDAVNNFRDVAWPAPKPDIATISSNNAFGGLFSNLSATLTIPAAPIIATPSPVVNPLANINLGGIASPWQQNIVPVPFLHQPPPMIQNNYQSNQANNFQPSRNNFSSNMNDNRNRGGMNNSGGGATWVRGNAPPQQPMRRGTCFQYQKTGFCRKRNNGCPYIHERS